MILDNYGFEMQIEQKQYQTPYTQYDVDGGRAEEQTIRFHMDRSYDTQVKPLLLYRVYFLALGTFVFEYLRKF